MYSRELGGQHLTLAASGWTYNRTFVLYDKETGTLWYPLPDTDGLTGVAGPLRDRFLPALPATRASWREWHELHPDTKFMEYPDANPWNRPGRR